MATSTSLHQRGPWSWSSRRWSTKKFVLAAMVGALVAVALVASISISLAPAHLSFAVVDASIFPFTDDRSLTTVWFYNLTLEANNTSHRTEASLVSLAAVIWQSKTSWIPADDDAANETTESSPWLLPPQGSTRFNFSVQGGQYNVEEAKEPPLPPGAPPPPPPEEEAGNNIPSNCTVVVEAKVKFRAAGGVSTLPYTVTVSCDNVDFEAGVNETQRVFCYS